MQQLTQGKPLTVAVLGGTGTAGSAISGALRARGHDVRVLSRRADPPARLDATDPKNAAAQALAGVDVLVDALNGGPKSADARRVLVDGLGAVIRGAAAAGVRRVISLAIVGQQDVPMGYYAVKREQEQIVRGGPVPATLVFATQFHQLVAEWASMSTRLGAVWVPRGPLQPVDPRDVAEVVADAVERDARAAAVAPRVREVRVAGPEVVEISHLARRWAAADPGRPDRVRRLPVMGGILRAVARGTLIDEQAPRGTRTFDAWLVEQHPEAVAVA